MSEGTNLIEDLGGSEGIKRVVESFSQRIQVDPRIGHFFSSDIASKYEGWPSVISAVCRAEGESVGAAMGRLHSHLKLEPLHFDAMMDNLREAMEEQGVPKASVTELMRRFECMRADVIAP